MVRKINVTRYYIILLTKILHFAFSLFKNNQCHDNGENHAGRLQPQDNGFYKKSLLGSTYTSSLAGVTLQWTWQAPAITILLFSILITVIVVSIMQKLE